MPVNRKDISDDKLYPNKLQRYREATKSSNHGNAVSTKNEQENEFNLGKIIKNQDDILTQLNSMQKPKSVSTNSGTGRTFESFTCNCHPTPSGKTDQETNRHR